MKVYVGLDTATVAGFALYEPSNQRAIVFEVKGEPKQQVDKLFHVLGQLYGPSPNELSFVMERQHHFRNAITARSLLERYGYIKFSLKEMGNEVHEVSPLPVRKFFECNGKREMFEYFVPLFKSGVAFTNNHTDALACAIFQAHLEGVSYERETLSIHQVIL